MLIGLRTVLPAICIHVGKLKVTSKSLWSARLGANQEVKSFVSVNKQLLSTYYRPGTVLGHGRITLALNIFPLILICRESGPEKCYLSLVVPNTTFFIGDLSNV